MSKYIYTTPEDVTFVKRDDKDNVLLEIKVSNFHTDEGVHIIQPTPISDTFGLHYQNEGIDGLHIAELDWLVNVLEDAKAILKMKQEEDGE